MKNNSDLKEYRHWYVDACGGYWILDARTKTAAIKYCRSEGHGYAAWSIREATQSEYEIFKAQREVERVH